MKFRSQTILWTHSKLSLFFDGMTQFSVARNSLKKTQQMMMMMMMCFTFFRISHTYQNEMRKMNGAIDHRLMFFICIYKQNEFPRQIEMKILFIVCYLLRNKNTSEKKKECKVNWQKPNLT